MSWGLVLRMDDGQYKTPNHGELLDYATNTKYWFHRPDYTGSGKPVRWDVEVHDIVTFDLVNGQPENVTLHKKHVDGVVYRYTGT